MTGDLRELADALLERMEQVQRQVMEEVKANGRTSPDARARLQAATRLYEEARAKLQAMGGRSGGSAA